MDAQRAHGIRRLHSLSGVVPLGVFLVEHLWATSGAIRGRAAFDARVIWLDRVRFGTLLEILFIGLPLAFHALYGVVLAFDKKQNPEDYPYRDQHFALLLRVSGLLSLLFIAWHQWELPLQRLLSKIPPSDLYDVLAMHLSTTSRAVPWRAIGYFLGLSVTLVHFTYGMISFSFNERNIREPQPLRRSTFRYVALGGILFLIGGATILSLATGWPSYQAQSPVPHVACP
jgi:succinate dehydrogenase / fumarate reductase cytochrome b subunit